MNRETQPAQVPAKDRPEGEDLWQRYGAERGIWTEAMLIALQQRRVGGNKWFSLIDKVASERTLGIAWEKVAANAGACGVDRVTIGRFGKDSQKRLLAVKEHLSKGDYQAQPTRRVEIPKAGSKETRPLGIPTVRDRVVQGAVRMVMEPIFEREFAPTSYGFRPGRGCKDALREVERLLNEGHHHIVDVDIKGYFDNIPHDALMRLVKERVADGKVLGLIEGFLKQGVLENGKEIEAEKGSPQGGLISPLLANIYLNPLDWLMEELGFKSVRYADDIIVLGQSAEEATAALNQISAWMEAAGLQLHPDKTRLVDMSKADAHFDFLGYRFKRSKRGRLMRLVRPKSKQKLREALKKHTKRCNAHSMECIIAKVNIHLPGWYGYFRQAEPSELRGMDGWLRMRLRSILRKRRKSKGRGRGMDHQRWPNRYFEELGLFSLEQAKVTEMSLLKRAKC
jgi:RNA-directed DNA polymerase